MKDDVRERDVLYHLPYTSCSSMGSSKRSFSSSELEDSDKESKEESSGRDEENMR